MDEFIFFFAGAMHALQAAFFRFTMFMQCMCYLHITGAVL